MGLERDVRRAAKEYAASLSRLADDIKRASGCLGLLIHELDGIDAPKAEISAMERRAIIAIDSMGKSFGLMRNVIGE